MLHRQASQYCNTLQFNETSYKALIHDHLQRDLYTDIKRISNPKNTNGSINAGVSICGNRIGVKYEQQAS